MRNVLSGFAAGIARLWAKGCLGKAAVILGGLVVLGFCGSIVGGGRAARTLVLTPTAAPALIATEVPSATARPTEAPRSTRAPLATTALAPEQAPSVTPEPTTIAPTEAPPAPVATKAVVPTEAPAALKPTAAPAPSPTQAPAPTAAPARTNYDRNGDGKVLCNDFDTQAQAKKALDDGYTKLDQDHDGIPCESLPPG